MTRMNPLQFFTFSLSISGAMGFQTTSMGAWKQRTQRRSAPCLVFSSKDDSPDDLSAILTARLPTSVDDQVRQGVESLKRASADGVHRHNIRLLLPVIGATELDDWPGGARQMMEAAQPLIESILQGTGRSSLQQVLLDDSDGVYAVMAQAEKAKDDSCAVLLPTAETLDALQDLDRQVGSTRNLMIINPQWKRRSDFGGFFGGGGKSADFVEQFAPTFSLTNLICEGSQIRIVRCYPSPWRVFVRNESESGEVDWEEVGSKPVVERKPAGWENMPGNQRDGGRLFDYGQPSYQEIMDMLTSSPNYTPKSPAERAAASFSFIRDSL